MKSRSTDACKNHVVHARFSGAELAVIRRASADAGLTVSAFMRSLALEGAGVMPFFTSDDRAVLDMLVSDIKAVGVNLNQVARLANSGRKEEGPELSDVHRALQTLLASVLIELRSFAYRGIRRRRGSG